MFVMAGNNHFSVRSESLHTFKLSIWWDQSNPPPLVSRKLFTFLWICLVIALEVSCKLLFLFKTSKKIKCEESCIISIQITVRFVSFYRKKIDLKLCVFRFWYNLRYNLKSLFSLAWIGWEILVCFLSFHHSFFLNLQIMITFNEILLYNHTVYIFFISLYSFVIVLLQDWSTFNWLFLFWMLLDGLNYKCIRNQTFLHDS